MITVEALKNVPTQAQQRKNAEDRVLAFLAKNPDKGFTVLEIVCSLDSLESQENPMIQRIWMDLEQQVTRLMARWMTMPKEEEWWHHRLEHLLAQRLVGHGCLNNKTYYYIEKSPS